MTHKHRVNLWVLTISELSCHSIPVYQITTHNVESRQQNKYKVMSFQEILGGMVRLNPKWWWLLRATSHTSQEL
jgi:hypothetical protein